jgi:hypothetical protein
MPPSAWKRADTDWFINNREGVVTWDVPLSGSGLIDPSFLAQLAALGRSCTG